MTNTPETGTVEGAPSADMPETPQTGTETPAMEMAPQTAPSGDAPETALPAETAGGAVAGVEEPGPASDGALPLNGAEPLSPDSPLTGADMSPVDMVPDPALSEPLAGSSLFDSISGALGGGTPGGVEGLPHDLSPWGMFANADIVVQLVMIGLALASVTTWSVWLAKQMELFGARRRARKMLKGLTGCGSLAEAATLAEGKKGAEAALVQAAIDEVRMSAGTSGQGLKSRIEEGMDRIEASTARRMTRGMGILATIGSVGPFVGLFGTVWGIMNSFVGISKAQTTNLAVVAPGIAEALLATAIGLVAAIPAVVIYNSFARSIAGYKASLGDIAVRVRMILSRDLDRRGLPLQEAHDAAE